MNITYDNWSKLINYNLRLTLACRTCGLEWVPPDEGRGHGAHVDPAGFHAGIAIPIEQLACPACNAHEAVIAGFRASQEEARRRY